MTDAPRPSHLRRLYAVAATALFGVLLLGTFTLTRFGFLSPALDNSWAAALAEGTAAGARQGTDLIFTGGPLSILFTRYFQPQMAPLALFFGVVVVLAFMNAAYLLFRHGRPLFASVALLLPLLNPASQTDAAYFILPVMFTLGRLQSDTRGGFGSSLLFCLATAGLIAAKFSVLPMALLAAVILDLDALRRRQPFSHLIGIFAFLMTICAVTGTPVADFPRYLLMSLDTSSGFAEAMGFEGNWRRLVLFLIGAMTLAAIVLARGVRRLRQGYPPFKECALVLLLAAYVFLCFKAGFVRFDLHELTGWVGLGWATCVFLAVRWPVGRGAFERWIPALSAVPLAISFGGAALALLAAKAPVPTPLDRVAAAWDDAGATYAALRDPTGWWQGLTDERAHAFARVRATQPLPPVEGSVDIIASEQSVLIAAGAQFTPRPTIQEYTTYSPRTMAANRAFFEGSRAPDNLLLKPGSIDGRFPTSAEGPLWPLFFERYEVKGEAAGNVWMARRPTALPTLLGPARQSRGSLDAPIPVPGDTPLFVRIDVQRNVMGRLATIAFRPPILTLLVTTSDGRSTPYRFVPEIAREGFLLSPVVSTEADLKLLLASERTRDQLPLVTSITLQSHALGAFFYRPEVGVTFQSFNIPYAPVGVFAKLERIAPLIAANAMQPPSLMVSDEGVFAHAPQMLTLPVDGAKHLSLEFGLRPVTNPTEATPDGVCFRVLPAQGDHALFEQCLNPTENPSDAGPHGAKITLPAGTSSVRLETACRSACAYDWSYWSKAKLD